MKSPTPTSTITDETLNQDRVALTWQTPTLLPAHTILEPLPPQ
jgi:hypothetical protein